MRTRATVEELYYTLKNTSLTTVLVEGNDDIIFYRSIEEDLSHLDVDMLPAGNKESVLNIRQMIKNSPIEATVIFVVDKDIWIHDPSYGLDWPCDILTTLGYSIENDLFADGDLENLMSRDEQKNFQKELEKFLYWYALVIDRTLRGVECSFRTHPGKILDDPNFYKAETKLVRGEVYPEALLKEISSGYKIVMRGKSLFALLARQLSYQNRKIKFGVKQLMAFCSSRKGENYIRMRNSIESSISGKTGSSVAKTD